MFLASCAQNKTGTIPVAGIDKNTFRGGTVADEPTAARVGQDILLGGGNAADAAVGMYFALAVTYPGAAGLGGGGVCLTFDPNKKNVETLRFPALPPTRGGAIAIPGNIRGMTALHARYGRLKWGRVIVPAESLARFGFPASRALVRTIEAGGKELLADPGLWRFATGQGGRLRVEGENIVQPALADTLGALRLEGNTRIPNRLLQDFAADFGEFRAGVTVRDIQGYAVRWSQSGVLKSGRVRIHLPGGSVGGKILTNLWQGLNGSEAMAKDNLRETSANFATAAARAFGQTRNVPLDDGGATTGFAAVDGEGRAVACTVTMYKNFGAAKMSRRSGILFAANPQTVKSSTMEGIPLIAVNRPIISLNPRSNVFYIAAVADGGRAGIAALATTMARILAARDAPSAALAWPRVVPDGSGKVIVEPSVPSDVMGYLRQKGQAPVRGPSLGRTNVISCPGGLPDEPATCRFRTDPRGYGMGVADGF